MDFDDEAAVEEREAGKEIESEADSECSRPRLDSFDMRAIADLALQGMDREYQSTFIAQSNNSDFDNDETDDLHESILGHSSAAIVARDYSRRVGTADDVLSSDEEDGEAVGHYFESGAIESDGNHDNTDHDCSDDNHSNNNDDNNNNYLTLDDNEQEEFTGFMSSEDFYLPIEGTGLFRSSLNNSNNNSNANNDGSDASSDWAAFDSVAALESDPNANGKAKIPIRVSIPPLNDEKIARIKSVMANLQLKPRFGGEQIFQALHRSKLRVGDEAGKYLEGKADL